ncbi:MAG: hypothetical protein V1874_07995 [Spirochaetota bacterium]
MRKSLFIILLGFAMFTFGCTSYWGVVQETKVSGDLKKYKVINVGWLDLNENKWKDFGYEKKEKWVEAINFMNQKNMPDYFNKLITEKKSTVVASKNNQPENDGLVIKFSNVEYVQRTSTAAKIFFGAMAGSDTLDLTIHFIDGKSGRELYKVTASIYSKAAMDVSGWGFEGRVNNCVYNLVYFINEKIEQ